MLNNKFALEFDIKTSEEINKQNIKQFFSTFLKTKNIEVKALNKIIYFYVPNIKIYHIFVFLNTTKNFFLPASFLKYLKDFTKQKNETNLRLYICEDFFAIYKNNSLIFAKTKNKESTKTDISSYVQKYLKFNLDEIVEINNTLFSKVKEDFLLQAKQNPKIEFEVLGLKVINFENLNRIKILSLFLGFLLCINLIFFSYKYFFTHKAKINKTKITFTIPNKNQAIVFQNLREFFQSQGIEIRQAKLDKKINLILRSKDKNKILKALVAFKEQKLVLKEINYLQDEKTYEAFVFSK